MRYWGWSAAVVLGMMCAPAHAGSFLINATERGWIQTGGSGNGTSSINNYLDGWRGDLNTESRDFFIFAVPALDGPVISATLILDTATFGSPDASETYQVTSLPGGFTFADLGTGTLFGSRAYTSADSGNSASISLNAAGIAAIASNTNFGVGGRITTLSDTNGVNEWLFAFSTSTNLTQLQINTSSTVPEPATVGLMLAGLAGIVAMRHRRVASK